MIFPAHQLCAINKLPESLIRGWLLSVFGAVHERNVEAKPDTGEPPPSIPQSADVVVSSLGGNTVIGGAL